MTFADLRALHAIIGAAIDDIERIYRPPSSLRRASLSSMTPALNPSSSLSSFRSSSKARSSISTDSDIEEEDDLDADDVPLTPLSASNARFQPSPSQGSANSVRFASGKKSRERSHTMSSLPQSNASSVSSVPPMPPPILKQPPLDFPDLDVPIAVVSTSPPDAPSRAAPSTPSSSPQISISPSVTVELENVGAGASTLLDPSLRQREWRKKCEDLTAHPDVIKATNRIVSACGQISAMVQKPFLTVCDAAMGVRISSYNLLNIRCTYFECSTTFPPASGSSRLLTSSRCCAKRGREAYIRVRSRRRSRLTCGTLGTTTPMLISLGQQRKAVSRVSIRISSVRRLMGVISFQSADPLNLCTQAISCVSSPHIISHEKFGRMCLPIIG